ncbi:MAG: hypothetical protein JW736_07350 [Deltaproteobacteria bacterium]|nr:hypothetical protein [Deltaproteobacteria bacterium]MBN2687280.1 hypothetical protein [Deltaproteobacteria bacterium]
MMKKGMVVSLVMVLALMLWSCGGLRYSQISPNAKEFHPKSIGVLPADVSSYGEARGVVDQIFAGILAKKGWFASVASPDSIQNQMTFNTEARKAVIDYITKLQTVNFSDPDLSKKIGEFCKMEAFLVVTVDFWNYTVEGEDKVAKVGFAVRLVESKTGKIMWEAGHHEVKDYLLFKPDLTDLAEDVAKMMIAEMPH